MTSYYSLRNIPFTHIYLDRHVYYSSTIYLYDSSMSKFDCVAFRLVRSTQIQFHTHQQIERTSIGKHSYMLNIATFYYLLHRNACVYEFIH